MVYHNGPEDMSGLDEIASFECLPVSEPFRALVHHNWGRKFVGYEATIPFDAPGVSLPQPLAFMDSPNPVLEEFQISTDQTRNHFNGLGSARINSFAISFSFDDLVTQIEWPEAVGDTVPVTLTTSAFSMLLLDILTSGKRMRDEDKLNVLAEATSVPDLLHSILAKMALFSGKYTIATRAMFDNSPNNAFIIDLIDGETPNNNATVLKIDLSRLSGTSSQLDAEELDSHQQALLVGKYDMDVIAQQAVIIPQGAIPPSNFILAKELGLVEPTDSYTVVPGNNYDAWLMVCKAFNACIAPLLKDYAYLDTDTPAEPVDFWDPDFRRAFPEL